MIPEAIIRQDALATLHSERFNAEGAALFATLPRRRDPQLLRLLVTFQILLDFLDTVSERSAPDPIANGRQLHLALVEALDPTCLLSDYYRHHRWREDGGYLEALVQTCREACVRLPSYPLVQARVQRAAARFAVQIFNHDPDPHRRDATLKAWVEREFPDEDDLGWWELAAAASSSLSIHALLALAADPACRGQDVDSVDAVYMPWACAASTMLDNYVDHAEDLQNEAHNYIDHYPDRDSAECGVYKLLQRATYGANTLRDDAKQATIVAGMAAMYLSKDSARTPEMRSTTRSLIYAGGSLTRLLLPILRAWRIVYARRSV
jgi:tetraprenyl-beta-curcumene synthase